MINRLKPKSEFSRNVLTLMTGTTIAQAIPIAISPILTRIYTPEDFGLLALLVAISGIIGSISTGRYELAIMLPKKDEDAINIFALGFIINILISLLSLIVVIIFHDFILRKLNNIEISLWLYFIPLVVFLSGMFNLLNYFNNRVKNYKDLAIANVYKSIAMAIVQLSLGYLKLGIIGLVSGQIVSQVVSNTRLILNINRLNLLPKIRTLKIIALAKRYKDFPKFSVWAGLLNTLSMQLTNILISTLFGIKTLGFYSFSQRILGMPSTLIGSSMGQVYFQEAVKEKQQTGRATKSFNATFKKLLIISIVVFGSLFFVVEDIFAFVFGEEWRIAGEYAKILSIFYAIRFISGTLAITMTIFEKQKSAFYINIILLSSILLLLYISNDIIDFLQLLSLILSFEYSIFLLYYWKLTKGVI